MLKRQLTPLYLIATVAATTLSASVVLADDIIIPVASQGSYLGQQQRPELGQKRQQVINLYGEPITRHPAIGEPPISRWDYANFSVYFENDVVLHSVLKHRRADSMNETPASN